MPGIISLSLITAVSVTLVIGCGKSDDNSTDKETSREVKEDKMVDTKTDIDQANTKETMIDEDKVKIVEIKTKGMSCSHCENSVKAEIGKLNGIADVTADAKINIVKVRFDSGKTDVKAIKQAIDDAGYETIELIEK